MNYAEISTVKKIDNKAFRTYRTVKQFKLFNRMHMIFANFDICLIFYGIF